MSSYTTTGRPSSSHYSRYDDGIDSEEEEEERRLSEMHGEAADDDGASGSQNKRKRTNATTETKLTEEDAAAAKQFEEEVRLKSKKARPALTPAELKSSKGLIYVRRSFPTQVQKYRNVVTPSNKVRGSGTKSNKLAHKMNTNAQLNAAASYSRSLMSAYRQFGQQLFPSLAVEDVFLKIEDLGSKKEVKDYLEIMRNEFRKEYMEGIYGTEKANRILNELEYGLKVHPMEMDENYTGQLGEEGGEGSSSRVMPRMGYAAGAYDDGEEEEEGPAAPVVNPYTNKNTESVNEEVAKETSPENTVGNDENATAGDKNNKFVGEEDDDEEVEASFEDDNTGNYDENNGATSPEAHEEPAEKDQEDGVEKTNEEEPTEDIEPDESVTKESENEMVETEEPKAQDDVVVEASGETLNDEMSIVDEEDDNEPSKKIGEEVTPTTLNVTENNVASKEMKNQDDAPTQETLTLIEGTKTQESLTLMESQFDDDEMEFTQDDRFSQVSVIGGIGTDGKETDVAPVQPGNMGNETQDDRFSQFTQTQNDQFTQDDNTERFSQFTQTQGIGPIFEEDDEGGNEDAGNVDENGDGEQLGQTMELSLEY